MAELKIELSNPYPVRLPVHIVEDLKREAAKEQRSFAQELRYRIVDSWERIPKGHQTNN